MHNYTKLNFEEAKRRYTSELDKELSIKSTRRNSYGTLDSIKIGQKYIDKILDDVFSALKEATQPISDFSEIEKGIIDLTEKEYADIFTRMVEKFNCMPNLVSRNGNPNKEETLKSIKRRLQLLQTELQFKSQVPSPAATINVTGNVGVINTGQVYGNIQIKLEKLKASNQTELLEAVTRLIETIKDSDIDDEVKREQVDNIDYLIAESEKPQENRNRGVIKSVETSLSMTANLVTIWGQVGPIIMRSLGVG